MEDPATLAPEPVREGISTTGPDRNWPYNSWWVATHGPEVNDKPILQWDIAMIEVTQAMARCAINQGQAVEFSVAADRAAVEGRRRVAAMVKAEREAG